MTRFLACLPAAGAVLALSANLALAEGRYDGTWVIEAPQAAGAANAINPRGCEPVRIEIQVKDNRVTGNLKRQTLGRGRVESSPSGAPVTGRVDQDGTLNAQWENYIVTGKLRGDTAEVRWNGECGPRVAQGKRVAEHTGSSTQPH